MERIIGTDDLIEGFARNMTIIGRQTAGLTHADSLLQPAMRGNCLKWVVGHIAASRCRILALLDQAPVLAPAQIARYDRGSAPILADGAEVAPLPELLDALDRAQGRIAAGLAAATPEALAREIPFGPSVATVSKLLFTLYFHETYHTGQTEYLRQLAGTDDHII